MSLPSVENRIERYTSRTALVEADPYGNNAGDLKPVYLYVQYGAEPYIDVSPRGTFDQSGIPDWVYNVVAAYYRLPHVPDATLLHDEIDHWIVPILEQINVNTERYYRDLHIPGRDIDPEIGDSLREQLCDAFCSLTKA